MKKNLIIKLFVILFLFPLSAKETFTYPGGKLTFNGKIWEEKKENGTSFEYLENGRDREWITLFDSNRKIYVNIPVNGGQAFFAIESERNKWKALSVFKKEIDEDKEKKEKNSKHEIQVIDEYRLTSCFSEEEAKLVKLIIEFRISRGLHTIPASLSLTKVAKTHLKDLEQNPPSKNCSLHSWSKKGNWTACCHTPDPKKQNCITDKPSEITDYQFYSQEIIYTSKEKIVNISDALKSLKQNQILTNEGQWKEREWNALGVGINGKHVIIWLGEEKDTKPIPGTCGN